MCVAATYKITPKWQHGQVWQGVMTHMLVHLRALPGATTQADSGDDIKPPLLLDVGQYPSGADQN